MGCNIGAASVSCVYNPKLDVQCVVHGDDFTCSGCDSVLDWKQESMQQAFLWQIGERGGLDPKYSKHARILNRAISCETSEIP